MSYSTMLRVVDTQEARELLARGLRFVSSARQLTNGTISLYGRVGKERVKYKITANGAVMSNDFVARRAKGDDIVAQYRDGLKQAGELFAKRFS